MLTTWVIRCAVAVIISLAPAKAEEGGGPILSGRIFSDVYVPSSNVLDGNFQQVSGSIWLQGTPKLGENSLGHFVFSIDDIEASSTIGSSTLRTSLREGFVSYFKSGWEFRMGKMILPWGRSDVINPTDFLTAKDFTFFNPDEEVRRLGATGLWLSWTPNEGNSPWTLTWVALPIFAQNKILIAPSQIPPNVTVSSFSQTPTPSLSNTETAFKLSYSGSQWDASMLLFRGWNHTPDFQVMSITGAYPAVTLGVAPTFHRYKSVGGDGTVSFGKWILRGESAYVWTENDDGQSPAIQPSHWDSVIGFERPLGSDFRFQSQLWVRYFPAFSNPTLAAINQEVAQTNALIQNYQDRLRLSGTFRFSYNSEQSGLAAELFLLANFVGGDYLVHPQVTYAWTDSLKTTLGADYYAGPRDRPLGVLAPYSAFFAEAKYLF